MAHTDFNDEIPEEQTGVELSTVGESEAPAGRSSGRSSRGWWRSIGKGFGGFFLILGVILLAASRWILATFGPISVNQMMQNIPGLHGGVGTTASPDMVNSFVIEVLVIPLALVTIGWLIYRRAIKASGGRWFGRWHLAVSAVLTCAMVTWGTVSMASTVDVRTFLRGLKTDASLSTYYVTPTVLAEPEQQRNLVLIYLESMDDAFGDADVVGTDLLTDLQESTEGWASIPQLEENPYFRFTIGGIVSSMCGTPPKPANGMLMTEDNQNEEANEIGIGLGTFMPNAVCLGDILKESGYTNVYFGGADINFANKGAFLSTHGYDVVKGRTEWEAEGETEFSTWGLSDRRLFENAKTEVKELHDSGDPFSLTMLTLDNHSPIFEFDYCPQGTKLPEEAYAIQCQSRIVSDFIEYMRSEGILDDTDVVVMADHQLFSAYQLSTYKKGLSATDLMKIPLFNRIWSPDPLPDFARTEANSVHLYPTILEMLGYQLEDHRAGLGVSLFAPRTEVRYQQTLLKLTWDETVDVFNSRSRDLYESLWEGVEVPGTGEDGTTP